MKSYPMSGKLNLVPLHVLEGSGNLLFEENRRPEHMKQKGFTSAPFSNQ
jgi:hypothetical protein